MTGRPVDLTPAVEVMIPRINDWFDTDKFGPDGLRLHLRWVLNAILDSPEASTALIEALVDRGRAAAGYKMVALEDLEEAAKCLTAAEILAEGYDKPNTAAKKAAARDRIKESE